MADQTKHTEAAQHLTHEQIWELNQKHGYFEYGDAQGDVSRAFAQDAIAAYLRVRDAAPELLEALRVFVDKYDAAPDGDLGVGLTNGDFFKARAAIAKATGSTA